MVNYRFIDKSIQKNPTKISVLDIHGNEKKDETIANTFNEHFIQVGSKLHSEK